MKIAYLGPEKTFTEKVAKELFPKEELISVLPIRNVILSVENEQTERGIVPLENFYNGHVVHTLDSLTKYHGARIIQEKSLSVVHCLGVLPNHGIISKIYSKDQALEQCDEYLCTNFPNAELITTASTAEAAQYITRTQETTSAAIANEAALKKSGLEILAKDICPNNSTRFVVLGKEQVMPTGDDKTILAIHPPIRDQPGVLSNVLNIFDSLAINLECIYSRPDGKKGYFFYVELDGHEKDDNVRIALKALNYSLDPQQQHKNTIKVLGSFPNSHWKDEN